MGKPAATTPRFELFRRLARRLGVPARNAEDIAQEALLRGWEARDRLEPNGDPAPYAVTIALNQARKHTRNARRRGEVLTSFDEHELRAECPTPEDLIRRRQREALLRHLIGQVEPKYRALLIMHEIEEKPLAEIAAELGLKLETVKTQHRRAREHLEQARQRWMAQQRSRGWDEEACVPVALGLDRFEGWRSVLHKLGAKVVVHGAFAVITGALVPAFHFSPGTAPWSQSAATHARAAVPPVQHATSAGGERNGGRATAPTKPMTKDLTAPGEPDDAHPAVATNGRPASPAAAASRVSSPSSAARPTASERERSLIRQARKAVEAHNARALLEARRLLDMHAQEFPRGQLAGEREALLMQIR